MTTIGSSINGPSDSIFVCFFKGNEAPGTDIKL